MNADWISVKDALPEFTFVIKVVGEETVWRGSSRCLMWDNEIWDGWMMVGQYYKKYDDPPMWEGHDRKPFNCTHWMYAPQPPKD